MGLRNYSHLWIRVNFEPISLYIYYRLINVPLFIGIRIYTLSLYICFVGGMEGEEHLLATLEMEASKHEEELLAEALMLQEELGVDLGEHVLRFFDLDEE